MRLISGPDYGTAFRSWGEPEAAQLFLALVRLQLQPLSLSIAISFTAFRRRRAVGSEELFTVNRILYFTIQLF